MSIRYAWVEQYMNACAVLPGGVSGVASLLPLLNIFKKTGAAIFPCRLCSRGLSQVIFNGYIGYYSNFCLDKPILL